MKRHLVWICLVFLAACEGTVDLTDFTGNPVIGTEATPGRGPGAPGESLTPQGGAALYQTYCSSCHGQNAEGTPTFPNSIQGFEPIEDIVLSGRNTMPAVPLSTAEVADIQAFLKSLAAPTQTLDGAGLYGRYCASCHGADATGGPNWDGSIQGYEPIETIVLNGRGDMAAIPITADDTAKIQAWLLTLAAPASELDGHGLYDRYCSTCHGADATGGTDWSGSIQSYEPIETIVLNGRGDMAAIPITADDTAKIQAWLLTLGTPASQLDGQGLYTRYCSTCHGADATGGTDWDGSIQGYEPITAIVQNGRGDMDPIPADANQTAEIQAYLLTLAPALSTLSGPEVYDRLCVGCHGDRGAGTDTKGLQLRYDDDPFSRYWVRAGRGTNRFDSDMPAYPADMISNQQLDEMFTWINAVPHPTDGEGLFNQYCANCHGKDGRGGTAGEGVRGGESFGGVVRNGKGGTNYGSRRNYMTSWSTTQLSNNEVSLLSAYAAGL